MAVDDLLQRLAADNPSLTRRLRALVRRSLNEGVGAFILSIALATAAAIAIRVYWLELTALETAMTREVARMVGTQQEPLDTVRQAGLVSAALSELNVRPDLQAWTCPDSDPACRAINRLHRRVPEIVKELSKHGFEKPERLPTSMDSCVPPSSGGWTYVTVPRQSARASEAEAEEHIGRVMWLSTALDKALAELADPFGLQRSDIGMQSSAIPALVQAYFITPESLLRIWTRRRVESCSETFTSTRLWAAKHYFDQLWQSSMSTTLAYIDYGGNGLVKTMCSAIDAPDSPGSQDTGRLLGALCTDYRLEFGPNAGPLMQRLFFQTAHVVIPDEIVTPDSIEVHKSILESGEARTDPKEAARRAAIAGQTDPVSEETIREALFRELHDKPNRSSVRRDITTIPIDNNNQAFLLPIGAPTGHSEHILFLPRSPRLPWLAMVLGVLGLVCGGAACASAVYGRYLRSAAGVSRSRLELLRNLQVGVIQVDREDLILAANDRAEEIFDCELPKFAGGDSQRCVNFGLLIEPDVWREGELPDGCQGLTASTLTAVNASRFNGDASAYYARLRNSAARWIRVSATPMLLVFGDETGDESPWVTNVFATVDDVPEVVRLQLEGRTRGNES